MVTNQFICEPAGGMRVGRDYQAKIPALIPKEDRNPQAEPEKALLIWCPCDRLTDEQGKMLK